jgi:hypothetical protein
MEQQEQQKMLERAARIEKQVLRWDLYAKIAPALFLFVCFGLLLLDLIQFEVVFWIGMVLFAFTAVVWWFWTIFSIRFLVKMLSKASNGLLEVSAELKKVKEEYRDVSK